MSYFSERSNVWRINVEVTTSRKENYMNFYIKKLEGYLMNL